MNRILIGSSNIYWFYRCDDYKEFNAYTVVKCTDIKTFDAVMSNLEVNDNEVIISVLENFLERSGRSETTEEGYFLRLGETFDEFNRIVKFVADKRPTTKFVMVDPIKRPAAAWYQNMFEDIVKTFSESIQSMRMSNITRVEGILEGCQQFEQDQVHLTEDSGQIFIEGTLSKADFFKAPLVDLVDHDSTLEAVDDDDLKARISKLEGQVRARQMNNNLVFARLREESDSAANKIKEDRLIITGITSKTYPPTDPEQRKVWIKEIAMNIFKTLIPDFKGVIHFVNQAKNNGLHIPMIEVKLESVESSVSIRRAFAEKKKEKVELGRIFIANCVGLTTRIRVDILKAMAKKISNNSISAHVVAFALRPVMHVRPKAGSVDSTPPRTYTFVDAAVQYGHLLKQVELSEAYRRVGTAFKGKLEQIFIVLREKEEVVGGQHQQMQQPQQRPQQWQPRQPWSQPRGGGHTSRKRQYEDDKTETEIHLGLIFQKRGDTGRGRGKKYHRGGL
jgi:hypothetical protein